MNGRKEKLKKKIHLKDCSITKKGIRYPYYALAVSEKVDGRNQKRILEYLGELNEKEVESYRAALGSLNDGSDSLVDVNALCFDERKSFLDVAVLHLLWKELGFDSVFSATESDRKTLSTSQIAEILVLSKLLKPSSATATLDWFESTSLSKLMNIDPDKYNRMKIFNELSDIQASKGSLERKLFEIAKQQGNQDFQLFFIDGTTTFFEGTHCEIGKSGKDKTTGFKTHMVLILLVTDRNGFPCAWDVYDGHASESVQMREITARIAHDYKIENITYCFDRGFACVKNFDQIKSLHSKFISGIDKDQIAKVFEVKQFEETRKKLLIRAEEIAQESTAAIETPNKLKAPVRRLPINGYYTSDGTRFFRDLGLIKGFRYVSGFSTEIFLAEREKRQKAQIETLLEITEMNEELLHAKKDRDLDVTARRVENLIDGKKLQKILEFTIIPTTVQNGKDRVQSCKIKYKINLEAEKEAQELDGIFVYISDHTETTKTGSFELTASEITQHYKDKYVIEQNFRDLKSILNVRPLFVRLPEHVRALVTVTVLAQFINRYIRHKIQSTGISITEFYTLLEKSSHVAILATPKRRIAKLIKTQPKLMVALEALGLRNTLFSDSTMAHLG